MRKRAKRALQGFSLDETSMQHSHFKPQRETVLTGKEKKGTFFQNGSHTDFSG